ncbi:MAG TPA: hypothetical protein VKV25_02605, partial [Acidimicrobiales bacterium]|nr:hypothetical protein [Acidimicrobiales bacterium]
MTTPPSHRLPRTVLPQRYDLELAPDLGAGRFAGTVTVDLRVVDPVDELRLNAAGLTITSATVTAPGGLVLAGEVHVLEELEQIVVRVPEPLGPGSRLHVSFSGALDDRLRGFYRSTFTDPDGRNHAIGATQFEATDARRAFPCWDEPDLKAVFCLTLFVPDGLTALSSSPIAAEEPVEG